jgi:hypothetical protein
MVDVTRLRKNAEKKVVSVAAAEIRHGDVSGTALQELFKLPANCLIIEAGVVVEEAGQANLTVDFGFDGGNELGNDIDIDGTGYVDVDIAASGNAETIQKAPRILTGTGKTVTAKFSADPTAGKFHFIVEYIDYTRGNGELMQYGAGA